MGMYICPRHGNQTAAFTSPLVAMIIENDSMISGHPDICPLKLTVLEVDGVYQVDREFCEQINQLLAEGGNSAKDTLSEAAFGKLVPVCQQCLAELKKR